jgi:exoribonuclease R
MYTLKTKDYKTFQAGSIIFEGALKANKALPGDLVDDSIRIIKRAQHTNIVGVLELASKTRYGFTAKQIPIYIFIPWNEAYPPFYVGSSHKDITKNVIAIIDFDHWLSPANCPRGNCRRIIGPCGSIEAEEEALLLHTCSERWTNTTVKPLENPLIPIQGGMGLNDTVQTFHVDPEGCRDIDDAISLWVPESTDSIDLEVRIHIADVASTLLTNPCLLKKAENIGQTVYRDGKVVLGMLPAHVQEKLSLLPSQYRQTITLAFTWNIDKKVHNIRWYQQEIMVKESYTYETILNSKYADVLKILTSELAEKDLEDSHDWIAELMLLYNKEVAKILRNNGLGILRRHGAPDLELLERLETVGVAPKHLAYKSGEYCLSTEPDVGHWGLQTGVYCHASSPIRRWADCVNQMGLLKILFNKFVEPVEGDPYSLNASAKKVKAYERDLVFLQVLLGHTSRVFNAVIVDVKESKVKIWVESWLRIVTVYEPVDNWIFKPEVGMKVIATVFYDAGKRNWKKRMVVKLQPSPSE